MQVENEGEDMSGKWPKHTTAPTGAADRDGDVPMSETVAGKFGGKNASSTW